MIVDQTETAAPASVGQTAATLRSRGALHRIFSFPVVLGALLVVLTVFTIRGRFNDPDMWWHLKTGEIIWNTHHIPAVDLFSFTANGQPWTAQEWLSELTIYGAYHFGGYSGLMLWLFVLASLTIIAGYALCWLYSGNPKVAFLGGAGIWLFSTVGLAIRPQMIGYLLLICELLVLHLGRTRNVRWFFALPPLFALWINCHSSFAFGLLVLAITLGCSFLKLRVGLLVSKRWERRTRNLLAVSFALSLAALFLNPIGPKLLLFPLEVTLKEPLITNIISEWRPADFSEVRGWALLGAAGLVLLVPLLRRSELALRDFALIALAFGLAVQHQKMLFIFGILAMPTLSRLLATAWDGYQPERDSVLVSASMMALAAIFIVLTFPSTRYLNEQVNKHNPVKALEFIERSGASGRMLNEYAYGGYLIWAAPKGKVFIDGRCDLYDHAGVLAEYIKWATLQEDPRVLLDKYRISLCLLPKNARIARVIPLLPGWKSIYSDDTAVVFARTTATKPVPARTGVPPKRM
ncbi:MAG TPA: hypothetical protein VF283_20230 [Bryobacteraceae bacterium]